MILGFCLWCYILCGVGNIDKFLFVKVGLNLLRLDKSLEKFVMWYREENVFIVILWLVYFLYF